MDNLQSDLAGHCMRLEQQRDELLTELKNIANAKRFDKERFAGQSEF